MPTLQVIHQDDDWNNSLEGEDPTHGNANTDASTVLLGSKSVKKQTHYVTIQYHLTSHACPTNMIKVAVSIHLKAIIQATGSSQLRDTRCKLHPFLFNHPSPPINEPDGNGHRGTPTVKLTTLVRPFKGGLNWIQQDTASWSRWYHPNSAAVELPPPQKKNLDKVGHSKTNVGKMAHGLSKSRNLFVF